MPVLKRLPSLGRGQVRRGARAVRPRGAVRLVGGFTFLEVSALILVSSVLTWLLLPVASVQATAAGAVRTIDNTLFYMDFLVDKCIERQAPGYRTTTAPVMADPQNPKPEKATPKTCWGELDEQQVLDTDDFLTDKLGRFEDAGTRGDLGYGERGHSLENPFALHQPEACYRFHGPAPLDGVDADVAARLEGVRGRFSFGVPSSLATLVAAHIPGVVPPTNPSGENGGFEPLHRRGSCDARPSATPGAAIDGWAEITVDISDPRSTLGHQNYFLTDGSRAKTGFLGFDLSVPSNSVSLTPPPQARTAAVKNLKYLEAQAILTKAGEGSSPPTRARCDLVDTTTPNETEEVRLGKRKALFARAFRGTGCESIDIGLNTVLIGQKLGRKTAADVEIPRLQFAGELRVGHSVWARAYMNFSDARYKEDVRDLSAADLQGLRQLRTVGYRNPLTREASFGLLAQDVRRHYPELVTAQGRPGAEDPLLGVTYKEFIPLLVEAVRSQDRQIDQLAAEIEAELRARRPAGGRTGGGQR